MKIHSTNYTDTFIEIADDCPTDKGEIPKPRGDNKTVAEMQYELILNNPYKYTSDDIIFQVFAHKSDLVESEYKIERERFFSKGQPCLRASPLTKRYGFGVHFNNNEKVALYGRESVEYEKFITDSSIKKVKAMRTSRK
jgi:hypothetical protein